VTPLERVRSTLEAAGSRKGAGQDWQCPTHDDRQASLSVTEGRDAKVIINCHAGCRTEDVIAALGLSWADLFGEDRKAKAEIVATYPYVDADGKLLYQAVRYFPKAFKRRRPDGKGDWIWTLNDPATKKLAVSHVLYQLPAVLAAVEAGQPVYVVEGEKDVHAIERAGATATTNIGGAKGPWKPDFSRLLAKPRTIVVADDDQPGHQRAQRITAGIAELGGQVEAVLPAAGKDAADHLAAGHGLDGFVPLGDATEPTAGRLVDAEVTVTDVLAELHTYQHLDDQGHVWFALAIAVTAWLTGGDPAWGMLVGSPSSGKTETLWALAGLGEHADELTGPAALLSWTKGKSPKPTGILTRIRHGLVTIADFSTVLGMKDQRTRDQLFALLRRVYDGSASRDVGTAASQLQWDGRLTLLAACTPVIDEYANHADALGPRWIYYRLPERSEAAKRAISRVARSVTDVDAHRARVRALAEAAVRTAARHLERVPLPEDLGEAIDDVAIVTCYGRAAVSRSAYGRREITGMASTEEPARLTKQLVLLARGLLALGMRSENVEAFCRKAALDSMPQSRLAVLSALADGEELATSEVARRAGCHRHVARYALEELDAIGVVAGPDEDESEMDRWAARTWRLDGPSAPLISRVLAGRPLAQDLHPHPHPPQEKGYSQTDETVEPDSDTQGQSSFRARDEAGEPDSGEGPPLTDADAPELFDASDHADRRHWR